MCDSQLFDALFISISGSVYIETLSSQERITSGTTLQVSYMLASLPWQLNCHTYVQYVCRLKALFVTQMYWK